jgi:ABC-type transport system involved in cytochrome c biogenesis permease component
LLGTVLQFTAFILIALNIPNDAPFGDTNDVSVIDPPIVWLALVCSFMLGLGDACYNTQTLSLLGDYLNY